MRGKLVPQDPTDEPASVLLERIAAEKAQLVKDGKIKKANLFRTYRQKNLLLIYPMGGNGAELVSCFSLLRAEGLQVKESLLIGMEIYLGQALKTLESLNFSMTLKTTYLMQV